MGKVVRYRPHHAEHEWTASIGMIVFLGSWAMMFGALFFVYGIIRSHTRFWPPPDLPAFPLVLPAVNTMALGLSSFMLERARKLILADKVPDTMRAIAFAATLGTLFLSLQLVVWWSLYDKGLSPKTGPYASVFYAMTCFHALHVLVGLGALGWLGLRTREGRYNAARHLPIRLWTMYWHFVGVVWGIMFVVLYVL
ncbi:MAG TPA: cytochrome c oxidase subunit 3 [Polyangiaceae bacterium]|nr:cytochrome c oxidase subunit 3 [Polyangiaceae bacterium]